MNPVSKPEGSPENLPENGNEGYKHENTCPRCGVEFDGYLPWHLSKRCDSV